MDLTKNGTNRIYLQYDQRRIRTWKIKQDTMATFPQSKM